MFIIYNEIRIQNKNYELKTISLVTDDLENALFWCDNVLDMLNVYVTMCWAYFILMWQFVEHALFSYFLTKCCIIRYAFLCWGKVFHTWTESPLHPLCICLAREQTCLRYTPIAPFSSVWRLFLVAVVKVRQIHVFLCCDKLFNT